MNVDHKCHLQGATKNTDVHVNLRVCVGWIDSDYGDKQSPPPPREEKKIWERSGTAHNTDAPAVRLCGHPCV